MTPVLLAGVAVGLLVLAARETVLAFPAVRGWFEEALLPLRRAAREGYDPNRAERRRLTLIGTSLLTGLAVLLLGPIPAVPVATLGPLSVGWLVRSRRHSYRRDVERELPEIATAIADAVGAGRSLRSALAAVGDSLGGVAAAEMSRLRTELELGLRTNLILGDLCGRLDSPRVDALCAALLAERRSGGDLADLLRRFAEAEVERQRTLAEARSATAQARFTGLMVVAMPAAAGLFAELVSPGFIAGILASPIAAVALLLSVGLQAGGFLLIRRLGRVEEAV